MTPDNWEQLRRIKDRCDELRDAGQLTVQIFENLLAEASLLVVSYPRAIEVVLRVAPAGWLEQNLVVPDESSAIWKSRNTLPDVGHLPELQTSSFASKTKTT
jgi:hypothetical protein